MGLVRIFKVFLLVGMMISLQGCFDYEEVEFRGVQNVSVVERTDNVVKLQIDVRVDNPNKFNIKVKKSTLDIYINDKYVGKTHLDEKIVLKKKTDDVYGVVLRANPKDILKAAMGSLGGLLKGSVTVQLKGDVKGSVYGISKKVEVDVKEEINLKDLM
jgi:LEA14-like dessication related protein